MIRYLSFYAVLIGVLFQVAPSIAGDTVLGGLMVHQPWARASIGQSKAGAAYLTVTNSGSESDKLIAAEGTVAKKVELHGHQMDDGVMKMRPVEAIEVAPGEPTVLKPGGLHVMLMGLKAPLVEGESFHLTLVFEKAGRIEVEVAIQKATDMEPNSDHGAMEHKPNS